MAAFGYRVSTIEKLYLGFNALRPPFCNQMVIEGRGRVDVEMLRASLDQTTAVTPGSCLRYSGSLGRMRWGPGPPPKLTVIKGAVWDGLSEVGAPFLQAPLDPATGPSCELQVVEAGERNFLIFRSLHAVMDGTGHRGWVKDIFAALRGEPLAGHPDGLRCNELAYSLTKERLRFPKADALHPCGSADAVTSGNDHRWRRLTVARPRSSAMLAAVAVALAAQARRHGEGPVRLNIPADLRYHRPELRTTGNFIGSLFVEVPPDHSPEAFLADLKQRLKAREQARLPGGYSAMSWLPLGTLTGLLKGSFAKEHKTGLYPMSATISDTGDGVASDYSTADFTARAAFFVPPMADQQCFVCFAGFGDRTDMMLALPTVFCSGGRLDALMAALTTAAEAV